MFLVLGKLLYFDYFIFFLTFPSAIPWNRWVSYLSESEAYWVTWISKASKLSIPWNFITGPCASLYLCRKLPHQSDRDPYLSLLTDVSFTFQNFYIVWNSEWAIFRQCGYKKLHHEFTCSNCEKNCGWNYGRIQTI